MSWWRTRHSQARVYSENFFCFSGRSIMPGIMPGISPDWVGFWMGYYAGFITWLGGFWMGVFLVFSILLAMHRYLQDFSKAPFFHLSELGFPVFLSHLGISESWESWYRVNSIAFACSSPEHFSTISVSVPAVQSTVLVYLLDYLLDYPICGRINRGKIYTRQINKGNFFDFLPSYEIYG